MDERGGGGSRECDSPLATASTAALSGTGNVPERPGCLSSSPASGYYHYQLASTSPGYHTASDGKSMGITP